MIDSAAIFPVMPRGAAELIPFLGSIQNFTFASGTPYNDLEYSLFATDFIKGETAGYDVFCPIDTADEFPGANTVKLVLCVSNVLTNDIYQAAQGDRVILGTERIEHPFFLRGPDGIDNDYAVIRHFDYEYGHIQLRGEPSDYSLIYCTIADGCATEGWYLFCTKDKCIDLIAFITPCWDVDSVTPSQDTTLLCNSDNLLDLYNPDQFRYAGPISPLPVIPHGITQFGSPGKDIVHGIAVDRTGNIYSYGAGKLVIGGWFRPPDNPPKGADGFVTLYGNLDQEAPSILAVQQISSPGFRADWVLDNTADSDGNIYAVGYTTGNLTDNQKGEGDMYAVKFDSALANSVFAQWGTESPICFANRKLTPITIFTRSVIPMGIIRRRNIRERIRVPPD